MNTPLKKLLVSIALLAVLFTGCNQAVKPSEGPEEVVKKFYSYIKEGGPTTLTEAYRLVDTKAVDEDSFRKTVSSYPRDMEVKVLKATIEEDGGKRAVVTIEYSIESSFGGHMNASTDINLKLDEAAKAWKIDFTGDTYNESPASYQQGGKE